MAIVVAHAALDTVMAVIVVAAVVSALLHAVMAHPLAALAVVAVPVPVVVAIKALRGWLPWLGGNEFEILVDACGIDALGHRVRLHGRP